MVWSRGGDFIGVSWCGCYLGARVNLRRVSSAVVSVCSAEPDSISRLQVCVFVLYSFIHKS